MEIHERSMRRLEPPCVLGARHTTGLSMHATPPPTLCHEMPRCSAMRGPDALPDTSTLAEAVDDEELMLRLRMIRKPIRLISCKEVH